MNSHDIKLVVFDLGRVLIRICDNWHHACEVAKVEVPMQPLSEQQKAGIFAIVCQSEVGKMDRHGFFSAAGKILGLSPQDVQRMSDAYLLGPFDGAVQLLDDLHA